jgi:hypothetical protein
MPPRVRVTVVLLLAATSSSLAACHSSSSSPHAELPFTAWSAADAAVPAEVEGSVTIPRRAIDIGLYLPESPRADQVAAIRTSTGSMLPGVNLLSNPERADPPTALVFSPKLESLPPPTPAQIKFEGRGIRPGQAEAIAQSKGVVVIILRLDDDATLSRLRASQSLALEAVRANGGVLWDEATHEIYSADEWQRVRVDGWEGNVPEVRKHIALHYDDSPGGGDRLVTFGMVKFGLPDLIVGDIAPAEIGSATRVLDGIAQLLVEGAVLDAGGILHFDLAAVKHPGAKLAFLAASSASSKLRGPATLVPVPPRLVDPDNRLLEVHFPMYEEAKLAERQAASSLSAPPDAGSPPRDGGR